MSPTTSIARNALTGQPLRITVQDGLIESVSPTTDDPGDRFIAPSFCDIQINGGQGIPFTSRMLTTESVRQVTALCRRHGIGQYLPTVITSDNETILASFTSLSAARESDPVIEHAIPGYHLEGPYLSGEDGPRGAHPRSLIRDPDMDEFKRWHEAAQGRIRMVTIAPERSGAIAMIKKLVSLGVIVAIGHTAATADQLRAAVDAGAKISTHLGNGCSAVLPRHDNPIWEQLAEDRLLASVIADGHHLPMPILKSLIRAKSVQKTILTSDASPLAGLAPGRYREWGQEFDVLPNGKIVVPGTPFLAGSGVFTDECVSQLLDAIDGFPLADAIMMASVQPRELLGLPVPEVQAGTPVKELNLFTWRRGEAIQMETM